MKQIEHTYQLVDIERHGMIQNFTGGGIMACRCLGLVSLICLANANSTLDDFTNTENTTRAKPRAGH